MKSWHDWNARVAQFVQQYSVKCWSVRCVEMHWNLAQYAANLPPDRWFVPHPDVDVQGTSHCWSSSNTWDTTLHNFCRYQHLGNWRAVARDANRWASRMPQFVIFCTESEQDHLQGINVYIAFLFSPVPFTGCLRAYMFHFTSTTFAFKINV